jgi:hypothetical protein
LPWQRACRQFFKNEYRFGLHRDGIQADVHGRATREKRAGAALDAQPANVKKMIQVIGLGLDLAKIR